MLMRVMHVIDDGVLHLFLQMGRLHAQFRHPIDNVDHQMEARSLVQHRQFERRIDVAFFLVAAHMQIVMARETVRELVDEPRIAVEVKDDRLVGGEQAVELALCGAMRMLGCRLQFEEIDDIDEAKDNRVLASGGR